MNGKMKYSLWVALFGILAASFFILIRNQSSSQPGVAVLHNLYDYAVRVSMNKKKISTNDRIRFTFTVEQSGVPAQLVEKKIYPHATIISNNLRDIAFYHIDDLQILENDTYEFEHQFSTSGEYAIWIEFNDNTTAQHHGEASDYLSRMNISISGNIEPIASSRLTTQDGPYRLQLIPDSINIGSPSKFRIVVTQENGEQVKLIRDIDHFFVAANPEKNFYVLDSPDSPLVKDNEVTISNVTFPQQGQYAFWIRLFPDDGTGKISSIIQGSFVLPRSK